LNNQEKYFPIKTAMVRYGTLLILIAKKHGTHLRLVLKMPISIKFQVFNV